MSGITASAPGKAVLCGEYAVLAGAPAACLALSCRARVEVRPHDRGPSTVSAPGYSAAALRFCARANEPLEWLDPLPPGIDHALLTSVWRAAVSRTPGNCELRLDTRELFQTSTGRKLGVGSSAALATALTAALHRAYGDPEQSVLQLADRAHREFQRGEGSGIDVATSFCGGVVRFEQSSKPARLEWPQGLSYRLFWSGHSANTRAKLVRYGRRQPDGSDAELAGASQRVVAALEGGQAAAVLDALIVYVRALEAFDDVHRLGIFGGGHEDMIECARDIAELVYKPCGAGGGDIGIAIAQSERQLHRFEQRAADRGFVTLGLSIDPCGVQIVDRQ